MKKITIIFSFFIFLNACSNTEDVSDPIALEIVTGMNLVDTFGNNVGSFGNPNVLNSNLNVTMYPNPAINILKISSVSGIKNVWIVEGNPTSGFKNTDFNAILSRDLYTNSQIKSKSSFDIEAINNTNISIDLARFEKGYYRVFIELEDGLIAWDNIYFRASQTDLDSINYWK